MVLGEQVDADRWQLRIWWKPFVTLIWAGGILIAQVTGWTLELTGSYLPILIYAGIAYLVAFTVIHLLVPRMEPAPIGTFG